MERMLDPRRLQILKAVVETGSVTAASRVLGYSPSAVSQSISSLERETKTLLFEKAGRGIRPTQAALLLAEHATQVSKQLQEAEDALEALRAGQAGRLRLAAFATAGNALVPRAMARFRESQPGVDLDLTIAESPEALAQLRSGQIDVAVIAEERAPSDEVNDLTVHPLLEDPYRVVLPSTHRLAGKRSIELGELEDDPWIATASGRCNNLPTVTSACARAGFVPRFTIEADEYATTIGFVAAGLGVAMVPMLALSSVPEDVRVRKARDSEAHRYVYCVTRRENSDVPIVRAMTDALRFSAGAYLRAA